jgi:hypothetical protein
MEHYELDLEFKIELTYQVSSLWSDVARQLKVTFDKQYCYSGETERQRFAQEAAYLFFYMMTDQQQDEMLGLLVGERYDIDLPCDDGEESEDE